MTEPLKTPVAFIIFNRPKCTRRAFERIREARPEKLYLIADAPRPERKGEAEKCAETRRIVEDMIDWPCEFHKNYAENNMGCRKRIITGIRWVFSLEKDAVILEDDIVADPTFFQFCSTMLDRYRHDENVMQIAGFQEINYRPVNGANCFFSKYTYIWGWATWRRAWNLYQSRRTNLEADADQICRYRKTRRDNELLIHQLKEVEAGRLDTWDYHWRAAILTNNGLSLTPARNMVRNIGFGAEATHTISPFNPYRFKRARPMPPPYRFPERIEQDLVHDRLVHWRRSCKYWTENLKEAAQRHLPRYKERPCDEC